VDRTEISRRRVVQSILLLGVGTGVGLWVWRLERDGALGGKRKTIFADLSGMFTDLPGASRVGQHLIGAGAVAAAGAIAVAEQLFTHSRWQDATASSARSMLFEQIEEDFDARRVVRSEGWVLARSEALLYALVAMLSDREPVRTPGAKGSKAPTVTVAATEGDPARGSVIYRHYCQGCHLGKGQGVEGLVGSALRGSGALDKTDEALHRSIRQGLGTMPGFAGELSDKEIRDVLAYLRTAVRRP